MMYSLTLSTVDVLSGGVAGLVALAQMYDVIDGLLEPLEGAPIVALFVVLAAGLFAGSYVVIQRKELGQALALATGIASVASVFTLLIALNLLFGLV